MSVRADGHGRPGQPVKADAGMTRRLYIDGVGSQLQGVGRLEDGRAVFVPGAIPGETVDARILVDKGRFCEASLCDVGNASPDRIEPDCPNAGTCGGCQARHIRYERTLELKEQIVRDTLSRIGGVEKPKVLPTIGCAAPNRSRNKAEYPIAFQDGRMVVGAFAPGGRRIVPLDDCLLQKRESVRALRALAKRLGGLSCANRLKYLVTRVNRAGELMMVLCADAPILSEIQRLSPTLFSELQELSSLYLCQLDRRPAHALDGRCIRVSGRSTLVDTLMGLEFELSPQAFFQVNPPQAEALYGKALQAAGIEPGCGLCVLDAYCGAGTITLSSARHVRFATGIEIVAPAIEDARRNAERNGLSNKARFICGDAAREIPRLLSRGERFDAAILDPPRKGADAALLEALIASEIPVIAYVSCNPATLARDVRLLTQGGYTLKWAQPVDMFPYTCHVESVVKLTRAGL